MIINSPFISFSKKQSYKCEVLDGENIMTVQNEDPELSCTKDFDPFPEPQTIPSGWDLSELLSSPEIGPAVESDFDVDDNPS